MDAQQTFDLPETSDAFIGDTYCYRCGARIWTHLSVWDPAEPWFRCADGCNGVDDDDESYERYAG